jgi:hypothetical protein
VEQEAANELQDIEVHDLLFAGVGGVAIAEGDSLFLETEDPRVRDRDAMGVGAEVREHAFRPCERGLRVDDPIDAPKCVAESGNGAVVAELSKLEGTSEPFEKLSAKHLG